MADTHINAFYAELEEARRDLALAQGRVNSLKEGIVSRGGELPEEDQKTPKESRKPVSKSKTAKSKEEPVAADETPVGPILVESQEPVQNAEPSGAEPPQPTENDSEKQTSKESEPSANELDNA